MGRENVITPVARINFMGEPHTKTAANQPGSKQYDKAFYGADSSYSEYCMNTTSWD